MCGFGEKDRRPVDPPPVVQLIVVDENHCRDEEYVSLVIPLIITITLTVYIALLNRMERSQSFIVHVTLRSAEDPRFALDIIQLEPSGSGKHTIPLLYNVLHENTDPVLGNTGNMFGVSSANNTQASSPGSSTRRSSGATGGARTITTTRVMMGTLVSSPYVLKDDHGNTGCFFCFPDLSVRCEGKYRLRFTLVKLNE
jgi:hypothetical protein